MDRDKYKIINKALRLIGQAKLTSTDDDDISSETTLQAIESLAVWDLCLEETLEGFDWTFARVEEALTEDEDFDPERYKYAYDYPSNCVKIRGVFYEGQAEKTLNQKFMVLLDKDNDEKKVVTDIEDAYARYTYFTTEVDLWTSYFVSAFSHRLASELAVNLNGDSEQAKEQITLFNNMISEAHRHDTEESQEAHEANEKANFVEARGS